MKFVPSQFPKDNKLDPFEKTFSLIFTISNVFYSNFATFLLFWFRKPKKAKPSSQEKLFCTYLREDSVSVAFYGKFKLQSPIARLQKLDLEKLTNKWRKSIFLKKFSSS